MRKKGCCTNVVLCCSNVERPLPSTRDSLVCSHRSQEREPSFVNIPWFPRAVYKRKKKFWILITKLLLSLVKKLYQGYLNTREHLQVKLRASTFKQEDKGQHTLSGIYTWVWFAAFFHIFPHKTNEAVFPLSLIFKVIKPNVGIFDSGLSLVLVLSPD